MTSNNAVELSSNLKGFTTILITLASLAACSGGGNSYTPSNSAAIPTITLSASPALVAYNGTATITWSSTNSTSCTSSPVGINTTSGSYTTPPLTASTRYTVTCTGSGGSASKSINIDVTAASIISAAAACAAEPMRGTVYYYCDCGTGAEAGCVAGSDTNSGTDPAAPRQTIGNAATRFASLAVNDTVALCKGGAFNAGSSLYIGKTCTAGTTCNDLREYTPTTFAGSAKPIINNVPGAISLFSFNGNNGGIRFLNLKLNGDNGSKGNGNKGFFFYNGAHDVTMCNLDMDLFDIAVYNESAGNVVNNNIKLTGNKIINSRVQGYLGAGSNSEVSYNFWDGNGSSNMYDHTLYISAHKPVANMNIVGNYIHGQYGSSCQGAPLVGHMAVDGLLVANNVIEIDAAASTGGCWGIAFDKGGNTEASYLRNATFSGNTIKNGGNVSLVVANCPNCIIENNLIMQNWTYGPGWSVIGIFVPSLAARAGVDDVNTGNKIRNNTIWFGPNSNGGATGIKVGTEGSGHVIANNTIYYASTSAGQGVNCYSYPLALSSYTFINNNHCYAAASYKWEATAGSLSAWQTASGFDTASITDNPLFKNIGTDFTPATGSPLVAAGNAANGASLDLSGKTRANPPAIGAYEP